jgi:hypothetical protein
MRKLVSALAVAAVLLGGVALTTAVAAASDTEKQAAPVKPGEKLARGEVLELTRVGDKVSAVRVRTESGETSFVVDAGTMVRHGDRDMAIGELKVGDRVDVVYRDDGERKIALRIEMGAPPKS